MVDFPFGAAIGAGAALIGGVLNREAQEGAQEAANAQSAGNRLLQTQFAQHGLTWRAQDVMNAYKETGIHPLAMLGTSGPSYTPSNYVGGANTAMGDAISTAGQGIGRSIDAAGLQDARLAHASRLDALVTERAGLENDLLKMRIASEMQQLKAASTPPMPIGNRYLVDGQGATIGGKTLVVDQPMKRQVSDPANPSQEPGAISDVGFARTKTGWAPIPSKDVKERIEDMFPQSMMWSLRNNLRPTFGDNQSIPFPAPAGKVWEFNPYFQEYRLIDGEKHQGFVRPRWTTQEPWRNPGR